MTYANLEIMNAAGVFFFLFFLSFFLLIISLLLSILFQIYALGESGNVTECSNIREQTLIEERRMGKLSDKCLPRWLGGNGVFGAESIAVRTFLRKGTKDKVRLGVV